jgi:hypothetical protein
MIEHPNVLPLTVVAALAIFIAREILEWFRRARSDSRKLHAIRRFLAAECEKNEFAVSRLLEHVHSMNEALINERDFIIVQKQNGIPHLSINWAGDDYSSNPIFKFHTSTLEKYLFDAANLDAELFELMEKLLDSLSEVSHVRESLISYVSEDRKYLDHFEEYATRRLDDAIDPIRNLYFKCTNEPLTKTRIR